MTAKQPIQYTTMTSKPPFPPFTLETAIQKARMAENAWNGCDPQAVAMAYTEDSRWRNRSEFIQGRDQILQFLKRKWAKELDYRLIKEVWAYTDNRIAVRFQYEWHDDSGHFFRSHGNENWEFSETGLMQRREASINDVPIHESDRLFTWGDGPRPENFPGLTELGL
jgi:nuclear transport factor 2 (NTF2) superfamily protein